MVQYDRVSLDQATESATTRTAQKVPPESECAAENDVQLSTPRPESPSPPPMAQTTG